MGIVIEAEIIYLSLSLMDGISQALTMLSRALEADPTSVVLWTVYLFIYYSEMKTTGKDDMYYIAVCLAFPD